MTCVIGIVKESIIYLGADSIATNRNEVFHLNNPKVFKSGSFLVGCSGSIRQLQILQTSFNPPKILDKQDIFEYIVKDVVTHIQEILKSQNALREYDSHTQEHDSTLLLGFKSRLFTIYTDFQVMERIENFTAIGSGTPYALGSIMSMENMNLTPKQKIKKALRVVSHFDPSVGGEIKIITSKDV